MAGKRSIHSQSDNVLLVCWDKDGVQWGAGLFCMASKRSILDHNVSSWRQGQKMVQDAEKRLLRESSLLSY
jgi:hypothetical protein